jgi:hypothetical protein
MDDIQDYYIKASFITRDRFKQTFLKNVITRYILYFFKSLVYFFLILFNRVFNCKSKEYKYVVSICGIFKNEAKFIEEWINFHLVIGVDHFYLYNNNSEDNYLEILQPYIDKGIVELLDWPFQHAQMGAYEDCYIKNRNDTNWLTFIDIDEFICPIDTDNLKIWLLKYKKYPGIAVYWKQFGSNGKLHHDSAKLVIEQYTQCWPKPSIFTKMFCNMDFPIVDFPNMHILSSRIFGIKIPPINQYKKIISYGINRCSSSSNSIIQINHYWGKAYDCFVQNKIKRTDAFYENSEEMSHTRKKLLKSHEVMCTVRDYSIQRFLLYTKLRSKAK